MTTATPPRPPTPALLTPADLLNMGDAGKGYELIDGQLKELGMSAVSWRVGGRAYKLLDNYTDTASGWAFPADTGFCCFASHPGRVRKPDAAFIAYARMSQARYEEEGFIEVVPDLVVEVVSPNDIARDVEIKRLEWLAAGVKEVWVVYPDSRTLQVYDAAGSTPLRDTDTLASPDLLPGFRLPVADLFRLPPGVPAQDPGGGGE